jgi:predicted ABC-type ATPase
LHNKPVIYSIIGPNGAGKSSSARLIADVDHFDFDATLKPFMSDVEQDILDDDYAFDFYRDQCVKDVQGKLRDWSRQKISNQESFSLAHNFFPGYSSNDEIVIQACNEGYEHKVVYLGIRNIETCIRRVQLRALKNHHFVQNHDIKARYHKGLNQLNEWFSKAWKGSVRQVSINEIRIVDYTADAEIESIADFKNGHLEILTQSEFLLAEWKILVPEMFPHQSYSKT